MLLKLNIVPVIQVIDAFEIFQSKIVWLKFDYFEPL